MSKTESPVPAAVVEGVSKTFQLPTERMDTIKERALHPLRARRSERFEALKDVSCVVQPGEFFGIVGRNGSGKSTLLKCLAGIYSVDSGAIYLDGRVSTFIELGVGFNQELAARDNVILNAVMLGLSPREARRRYDRVIDFAELREFEELKLKNYSSGMQVRLAFAVMIQVDADILLIDEVLAVGDAAFQQKCFDVFNELRDEGKTILLVTHDMAAVKRLCHRAMLIERGEVVAVGDTDEVAGRYVDLNFETGEREDHRQGERGGDGTAEIVEAWWEDERGTRIDTLKHGDACSFSLRVRFRERAEHPAIAVVIENEQHLPLLATSSEWADERPGAFEAGEEIVFSVHLNVPFAPGRIFASPWVAYLGGGRIMDRRPQMSSAVVTGTHVSGALVDVPHDVRLELPDRVLTGGPRQ